VNRINEDNRFDEMRGDPIKFLFFWIFQFAWVYIVSLPLIFLNGASVESRELSSTAIAGIGIAGIGLIIVSILEFTTLVDQFDLIKIYF
jgi:steroid 5-alpha reductase family enzyme